MPYVSEVLYHLVGSSQPTHDRENFEVLRKVLRSGELWTNSVGGKRGLVMTKTDPDRPRTNGEFIEATVTCFCDIPRNLLGRHTSRYGRFGVGIDRTLAAGLGARPVIYLPEVPRDPFLIVNGLGERILQCAKDLDQFFPGPEGVSYSSRTMGAPAVDAADAADQAQTALVRDVLAFIKVFDVTLPEDHPENFYMEREWRKYGNMPLKETLREVIAPAEYHTALLSEFPGLGGMLRSVPDS